MNIFIMPEKTCDLMQKMKEGRFSVASWPKSKLVTEYFTEYQLRSMGYGKDLTSSFSIGVMEIG